ncbi:MAG: DUF3445 domain-containing protein, partial [Rhodospirillaceae bacterium]
MENWLSKRDGDDALLLERARLIASRLEDVIQIRPQAETAVEELTSLLATKNICAVGGSGEEALKPIGKKVAEDICILTGDDSRYRLSAAVLCFPNRWRLAEKMGRSVT